MPLTQAFARLVRPASPVRTVVAALACTAVATAVRLGLDPVLHGATAFSSFFPAVLLATLWAGGRAGLLSATLCLGAAWAIIPPHFTLTGDLNRDLVLTLVFAVSSVLTVALASGFRRALQAQTLALNVERDAAAQLAANERRLRMAQEAAGLGIWEWDVQADRFWLSSGYRRNWNGVDLEDGPGFDTLVERLHPQDRAAVRQAMARALETGLYEVEYRAPTGDGGWRWLASRGELVRDDAGRPAQIFGVNRDVTREKAAAEALRDSESKFRGVFESPVLGLGLVDLSLDIDSYEVNDRFLAIVGCTRAQYDRREWRWETATPEEHTAKDDRAIEQVRERGWSDPYEKEYLRPDGSRVPVLVSAASLPGRPDKLVATVQDISEQKAAERALRESEARFRAMADSAPAPVWTTLADGGIAFANEALLEFAGLTPDAASGLTWVGLLHPDDRDGVVETRAAAVAHAAPYCVEARFRRADGDWRWMQCHCKPRLDADGRLLGYVGIAFDVTKTKQAEAGLKRVNEFLEERVAAALAEKAQAEAALMRAQKLEAVGRLTGGVAHDFNNLLTVVIGSLDMILRGADEARRRRLAEAAMAAARRGASLTHQLLAFSRRQALRPELCDVAALVREGEPLLRRAVGESVRFETRTDGAAKARVDPAQFEAALLNLVVNARDATPEGGCISVEVGHVRLEDEAVPETPAGDYVRVAVRDDGEGMAPEVLARVFEPFFTTKAPGKGTGLGLAQVYGFARQSGGGVSVRSEQGRGTTVAIHLPVAAGAADALPAPRPANELKHTAPLEILLVEDDAAVAAVAEGMLTELGHRVRRAEDGTEALRIVRSGASFDLLLTDVVMPGGINGVHLAREAVGVRPGLQVLLTSGYAGDALDGALADAPWPFLRKPYSETELAQVLQGFSPRRAERVQPLRHKS